jgi:hypothetical protein
MRLVEPGGVTLLESLFKSLRVGCSRRILELFSRRICAAKMTSAPIAASSYSLVETIAIDVAGSIFAISRTRCR